MQTKANIFPAKFLAIVKLGLLTAIAKENIFPSKVLGFKKLGLSSSIVYWERKYLLPLQISWVFKKWDHYRRPQEVTLLSKSSLMCCQRLKSPVVFSTSSEKGSCRALETMPDGVSAPQTWSQIDVWMFGCIWCFCEKKRIRCSKFFWAAEI